MNDTITMLHGSGGRATSELIGEIFTEYTDENGPGEDAAVVEGAARLAMTTDSFVITPLFYPGGDIGRLCVCGTVNDLLMRGAEPKYLSVSFIMEEGLKFEVLRRVSRSIAETAKEAGVRIVCGDTKVVEGSGGLFINTAGVGFVPDGVDISAKNAKEGDVILVSGNLGDHHAAILTSRLNVENEIKSDNAPLTEMVRALSPFRIHALRDVTRGGLATVCKELAEASEKTFTLEEEALPVSGEVKDFAGMLGLDPLYMGNEGKLAAVVDERDADAALAAMRSAPYGENAARIGTVSDGESGMLCVKTPIGGRRSLSVLADEGLPRIC